MGNSITFHCNPSQPHQRDHGEWLTEGFKRHGLRLVITSDRNAESDIHIISGPHYAKRYWLGHPRVILLDRAKYHQEKSGKWHSMDWVSLGWMNEKGGCDYKIGEGRKPPAIIKFYRPERTIFLADYNGVVEDADVVRLHPDNATYETTLEYDLKRCSKAIGYQTSALVTAGLLGLEIECKDETNIMYQGNWRELLAYADWESSEIQAGEAWEHLKCH